MRLTRTRDYKIRFPRDVTVRAACEDVGCESWQYGWETILDERTAQGHAAAVWIRSGASRRMFTELPGGDVAVFRFASRQRCFEEHRTRPCVFLAGGRRVGSLGEWTGDLDDHVNRLEDQLRKG